MVSIQLMKCILKFILLINFKQNIISQPPILPQKRNTVGFNGNYSDEILKINKIAFSLKRSGRIIRKVSACKFIFILLCHNLIVFKTKVTIFY